MKNYAFITVHAKNDWQEISKTILDEMHRSGLWEKLDRLFVFTDGNSWFTTEKTELFKKAESDFEFPAIEKIKEIADAAEENIRILYLHTKGSSKNQLAPDKDNMNDWFKLMLYATVSMHNVCFKALESHDACGANYSECKGLHFPHHFSGNFWWANSNYIKTLPPVSRTIPYSGFHERHNAEFWIGENKNGKMYSIINSNVNHYHQRYPEQLYREF